MKSNPPQTNDGLLHSIEACLHRPPSRVYVPALQHREGQEVINAYNGYQHSPESLLGREPTT